MKRAFIKRYAVKLFIRLGLSLILAIISFFAALRYGIGIEFAAVLGIAVFIAISVITKIPFLLAPGWDGTVTGKTVRYTTTRGKLNVPEYALTVTDDKGREHHDYFLDEKDNGEPNRIEYYDNGERVRFHRGFKFYEKFNKSGKSSLVCIGCGKLSSKDKQRCQNCGLPLLHEDILS
jgi:hypothetical protein